ncbi:hypothetical protein [Sutcliffiella horikoshii]|uniref:hypothetical protein n=1 Tax=Sutcliffiella horikoshii TaxID=79883 RepID=UPI003CF13E3C
MNIACIYYENTWTMGDQSPTSLPFKEFEDGSKAELFPTEVSGVNAYIKLTVDADKTKYEVTNIHGELLLLERIERDYRATDTSARLKAVERALERIRGLGVTSALVSDGGDYVPLPEYEKDLRNEEEEENAILSTGSDA